MWLGARAASSSSMAVAQLGLRFAIVMDHGSYGMSGEARAT